MNDAPEIALLTTEEKRFWRLIEERRDDLEPDMEVLVLACGHKYAAELPPWRLYYQCTECMHYERINRERSDNEYLDSGHECGSLAGRDFLV